ncbi:hypothetical protein NLO95_13725 [Pseudomonas syringae]|nr:hypothetical protein [Pseudomonas syringae]
MLKVGSPNAYIAMEEAGAYLVINAVLVKRLLSGEYENLASASVFTNRKHALADLEADNKTMLCVVSRFPGPLMIHQA